MGNFQKNSKIYAGDKPVTMFENNGVGWFTNHTPDFEHTCLKAYRKFLGDAEIKSNVYKNLTFLPYISLNGSESDDRIWLAESYIGIATGKTYRNGSDTFIEVQYTANKKTFKPSKAGIVAAYSEIERLAWVNENEVSDTGY